MNWVRDYSLARDLDGLRRYVEQRIPTGSFLRAILENDLKEACIRADSENVRVIPVYVCWLYNEAPGVCWGSPEKVKAWLTYEEKG